MTQQGLNKVDLIFEQVDAKEVLKKANEMTSEEIIKQILESGLKGRGGAGFPTGLKWKYTAAEKDPEKYIVCNADEGEPGTFKDREILDRVSYKVYAGMAIAGMAIGARQGIVYLRGEYKFLLPKLLKELDTFHKLLKDLGLDFTISYRLGSGAYICGEESALFESIQGERGEPRNKPPYPTSSGVFFKPTSINNVETLVTAVMIILHGAEVYNQLGTKDSRGSKVFSVSGDTPTPGIFELELGMTVQQFVNEFGDGDTKAVQVGVHQGSAFQGKNSLKQLSASKECLPEAP
jgi:[NiFe] hydrogenase diaphorase moiety large subunit